MPRDIENPRAAGRSHWAHPHRFIRAVALLTPKAGGWIKLNQRGRQLLKG
jgi:hypothetical protein